MVFNNSRCQPHAPIPQVCEGQSRVSKPVCCCKVSKSFGVGMFCPLGALCKALGKRNGFGDDVVAQQPPHPSLVVHNIVCHVTPCVFPFFLNCEWNSVAARNGCCVCGVNAFMFSPNAWANTCHNAFTNLHSKDTWSTVILLPHLHLCVGYALNVSRNVTLLESAMSLTNGQLRPPWTCGYANVAQSTMERCMLPSAQSHKNSVTLSSKYCA